MHFSLPLIEKRLQRIAFQFAHGFPNRFPQAGGNPTAVCGIEFQSGIHDGFIGGDHGETKVEVGCQIKPELPAVL